MHQFGIANAILLVCNSGMLVRGPPKENDVDAIFNQARQSRAAEAAAEHQLPSSSSRSFAGMGRLLSGEVSSTPEPEQPQIVTHNITFWSNGFTIDDGPLRRLDDPANAPFLEVHSCSFVRSTFTQAVFMPALLVI